MSLSRAWVVALGIAATIVSLLAMLAGGGPALVAIAIPILTAGVLVLGGETEARSLSGDGPSPTGERLPDGFGRTLLQQLPIPLLVVAPSGRISYANPATTALFREAAAGVHYSSLFRAPAFVQAFNALRRSGEDRVVTFTVNKGSERHFQARLSRMPVGGDFGAREQVIVLLEDRTRDRLAIQARSDFVANASHELRTPLASILGYIETLQNHARDDPQARERFLDIMAQQADRMNRLIDDLMSLNRIEMNAYVRPVEQVSLTALLTQVRTGLEPYAAQSGVTLSVDLKDLDRHVVRGDHDQLNQVMTNLVQNAIKYGGSGSAVTIRAAAPDPRFPRMLGISVIDNGPGIERHHIPRLTERFYRVNAPRSKPTTGTGLGLAIVKHILNRHEGRLDIASAPGRGSTFTVWLPAAQDSELQPEHAEYAIQVNALD